VGPTPMCLSVVSLLCIVSVLIISLNHYSFIIRIANNLSSKYESLYRIHLSEQILDSLSTCSDLLAS
jgi:hypothetical protein